MLRSCKEIKSYTLEASDGRIGHSKDFLFDDSAWTIRYMVADTGTLILGQKVLISPISLGQPNWKEKLFPIRLTKDQIKESPSYEEALPVSIQREIDFYKHFGWPFYWTGAHLWGLSPYPTDLYDKKLSNEQHENAKSRKSHLRSIEEVTGYHVQALDDKVGHVEDFLVEDQTWSIKYIIVDTKNWLPGKKVIVSPEWIDSIKWVDGKINIDLTKNQIENSPEYNPSEPINREYEVKLYDFYGRPKYWD